MDQIRIIVAGSLKAGKKSFIGAVAEQDIVMADDWPPLPIQGPIELLLRVNFGRIKLNDDVVLYLMSSDHPDFIWEFLNEGTGGLCLFVDSSNIDSLHEAQMILKEERPFASFAYIVVANKQDREDAMTVGQIRRTMELPEETIILPCVATERASVAQVLNTLLTMIRPDLTDRIT